MAIAARYSGSVHELHVLTFEERGSDSPVVERVWTARSERAGVFSSIAACHWEMVVTRHRGRTSLTVRGPETRATRAECPADGEWVAIRFKAGTFWPDRLPATLRDRNDLTLPAAGVRSFWLNGSAWEYPTSDNADLFVNRLVRKNVIGRDPIVEAVLRGEERTCSRRSVQRRFRRATGITHAAFRSIERARAAANFLQAGMPIVDVVHRTGYFDQAHLTRAFKHLIGQTPADVARATRQLSFLYKTVPLP
jgi:AraC-like DNA-binding protein